MRSQKPLLGTSYWWWVGNLAQSRANVLYQEEKPRSCKCRKFGGRFPFRYHGTKYKEWAKYGIVCKLSPVWVRASRTGLKWARRLGQRLVVLIILVPWPLGVSAYYDSIMRRKEHWKENHLWSYRFPPQRRSGEEFERGSSQIVKKEEFCSMKDLFDLKFRRDISGEAVIFLLPWPGLESL